MTYKIFLDANFLLIPVQLDLNIYELIRQNIPYPWEIVIISPVIEELRAKIERNPQKSKLKRQIHLAQQILSTIPYKKIKIFRDSSKHVDDLLLEFIAKQQQNNPADTYYLATNDKELRKKSKKRGIRSIFIRKEKWLAIDDEI